METGDPDDVLTLLLFGSHPSVQLRAVTITPGSEEQVALVRWLLNAMELRGVRLGAQGWPANVQKGKCMNGRFYDSFGRQPHGEPECEPADRVLLECCDEATTLITGAPLHNLGDALRLPGFRLGRWVAQGGFAGEGVVPPHLQMDKFRGKKVCPTWNFNGDIPATTAALASPQVGQRILVSKNVCHRANYDAAWHARLTASAAGAVAEAPGSSRARALELMRAAMDAYLGNRPGGKKLHDPLALATALDEAVCTLAEVEVFHQGGRESGWGSLLAPGSGTWISVDYDPERFQAALLDP